MKKKVLWFFVAALSVIIGLYPSIYFFIDRKFGLLSSKSTALLSNTLWNVGFYTHILPGGLALLIGWTQFGSKFRNKNMNLHRLVGKVYVIAALLSSVAGTGIAFTATGGIVSSAGFICLGIIWFYTTLMAYQHIRKKKIEDHKKMMIYSYAACFSAVTLRIWLPLLTMATGNFTTAYNMVAWLCWVPNIYIAYLIIRKL